MAADRKPGDGGLAGRVVRVFIDSRLTPLLLVLSIVLGVVALMTTPREEEPQIVVPLADVFVNAPDLSEQEVEQLVTTPLERLLWQIDGVEHVYSMSMRGRALVTVRFRVGENREGSFVKLATRVAAHYDEVPPGVTGWVIKPVEIDDVSVVAFTLVSDRHDGSELRRVAGELRSALDAIPDVSQTTVIGGATREVRIEPDAAAMSARLVTLDVLHRAIRGATADVSAGAFERDGKSVPVFVGGRPEQVTNLRRVVVAERQGAIVRLEDVARVTDAPADVETLVRFSAGPSFGRHPLEVLVAPPAGTALTPATAVTISVAKKKGTNAVNVARDALARMRGAVDRGIVPSGVGVVVTRNQGATADRKVDELVESLWVAIATVIGLVAIVLGFREGFIVALAVPVTFAITLIVNEALGFSVNRVTLFALILSLGLVVDDPIVDVENIARHLGIPGRSRRDAVLDAVNEVRPPIVLATLAVMVSFLPMFFITGMMGPYMRPMALNVPVAMLASMIVAFTLTPWLSNRMLRAKPEHTAREGAMVSAYRRTMDWLLERPSRGVWLLLMTGLLFAGSLLFPALGLVPLKMLPFDNKDEFQVLVDRPDGTSLASAAEAARAFEHALLEAPEVSAVTTHVGTTGPLDFNGLVRHNYLRGTPNLADLRVNLVDRRERTMSAHDLVLRLRHRLEAVGTATGCTVKILEPPPGPPVLATIAVEVTGDPGVPIESLRTSARSLATRLAREPGVVDVDTSLEEEYSSVRIRVNAEKAARHGLDAAAVAAIVQAAHSGAVLGTLADPAERSPIPIVVRLPRSVRSGVEELRGIPIAGRDGMPVRLGEIADVAVDAAPRSIWHKDLQRVVFVLAEMAGRAPADAIFGVRGNPGESAPPPGVHQEWAGEGEWQITVDVFRDLGLAFCGALVLIWVLLAGEMKSYALPLIVMASIPLTAIGIFPGFALLNVFADKTVGGFGSPVFFTATAMIGMIALSGIVVRNSIMLVEFIRDARAAGLPERESVVSAGAVRLRPVLMTAGTALLGAWPITLDPIFSGLAWALIFGLVASTAFTMFVVPIAYWKLIGSRRKPGETG